MERGKGWEREGTHTAERSRADQKAKKQEEEEEEKKGSFLLFLSPKGETILVLVLLLLFYKYYLMYRIVVDAVRVSFPSHRPSLNRLVTITMHYLLECIVVGSVYYRRRRRHCALPRELHRSKVSSLFSLLFRFPPRSRAASSFELLIPSSFQHRRRRRLFYSTLLYCKADICVHMWWLSARRVCVHIVSLVSVCVCTYSFSSSRIIPPFFIIRPLLLLLFFFSRCPHALMLCYVVCIYSRSLLLLLLYTSKPVTHRHYSTLKGKKEEERGIRAVTAQ